MEELLEKKQEYDTTEKETQMKKKSAELTLSSLGEAQREDASKRLMDKEVTGNDNKGRLTNKRDFNLLFQQRVDNQNGELDIKKKKLDFEDKKLKLEYDQKKEAMAHEANEAQKDRDLKLKIMELEMRERAAERREREEERKEREKQQSMLMDLIKKALDK